ncbi:MAG: hypothetical protein AAB558_01190 [Patescibacteria group bacterium]
MEDASTHSFVAVEYKIAVKEKKNKKQEQTTGTTDTTATDTTVTTTDPAAVATQALSAAPPAVQQYINFQNPTWDTFLFVFFLVAALLYGVSLGRDRIIVILISIYMALAVVQAIPDFVLSITINQNFAFQMTAFIALFVVLFFLFSRSALINTLGEGRHRGGIMEVVVFSFLHVGLLISIAMGFLPADFVSKFSPLTITIFTNEWAKLIWIVAPIAAMIVLGRRDEDDD